MLSARESTRHPVRRLLVALALVGACGPETVAQTADSEWMLGIFSSRYAGELSHEGYVTNYEIREDGKFLQRGFDRCGMGTREEQEHAWHRVGTEAIEVNFLDGATWRVTPGGDCNELRIQPYFATQPEVDYTISRGEVCVRPEPCSPDVGECFCETYWCDAPPPVCGEL